MVDISFFQDLQLWSRGWKRLWLNDLDCLEDLLVDGVGVL